MRNKISIFFLLLFSLLGFLISSYLGYIHLGLLRGDLIGGAACGAADSAFNCHAVSASPWGVFWGWPLAFWGVLGYLACFLLALDAWIFEDKQKEALRLFFGFTILFILLDTWFFYVMAFEIKYLCALCLSTYGINIGLLLFCLAALSEPIALSLARLPAALGAILFPRKSAASWIFLVGLFIGALGIFSVNAVAGYLTHGNLREQIKNYMATKPVVEVDTTASPKKGSEHPDLTMVEFSDFLCRACQKASKYNTIIMAGHRQDTAIVFKHYPLDPDCNVTVKSKGHPGSCQLAAAAVCAQEQGKFWEFHDLVYQKGPEYKLDDLEGTAKKSGLDLGAFESCRSSGRGMEVVKRDMADADRLGVSQTPTYIVNGILAEGVLPPHIFEEFYKVIKETKGK